MGVAKKRAVAKNRARTLRRRTLGKVASGPKGKRVGSSFEDFLEAEGLRTEVTVVALKRVIAWQLKQEMERQEVTKRKMAELMETSRAAVDRLLDPGTGALSLKTLDKAAQALGKRVAIELVDDR